MAALRSLVAGALLAVLGSAGCASFVRPDGPRPVAPGERSVSLAPSVYVGQREDGNAFNVDLIFRYGIASRTDFGLRFNVVGVSTDAKVHLVRAADPTRGVDLAVAPSVGYGTDLTWSGGSRSADGHLQVGLPVLVGINLGKYQLLLTPQLLYQHVDVLPAGVLNAGGTVAFGRVDGRGFSLYPALAIWKALDPRHPIASLKSPGQVAFQPTLVFRWGR
jgi:hypothetical protein